MAGQVRIGIGGWTFEPWRGVFYPDGLPHKRELEYAAAHVTAIEINATYHRNQKPESFANWAKAAPDGFRFAVKASKYATNAKRLDEKAESVARVVGQGLVELGDKLGPISWQLASTKRFDEGEIDGFLALLPRAEAGVPLQHALEVRHESFDCPEFVALARKHEVAIVLADSPKFPRIEADTAPFTYARLLSAAEEVETGYTGQALDGWAAEARRWASRGDAYVFFINGAKVRAPAAAAALIARLAES
jgi:uncharacterized protein YecE (DUF72 family)